MSSGRTVALSKPAETATSWSRERADSTTCAPASSSAFAVAAPMPVDAPTIHTFASLHAGTDDLKGASNVIAAIPG